MNGHARHVRKLIPHAKLSLADIDGLFERPLPALWDARGPEEDGNHVRSSTGLMLGPDLWNASYDSLLRLDMPQVSRLVGYADDVVAFVAHALLNRRKADFHIDATGKEMDDCSSFQPCGKCCGTYIYMQKDVSLLEQHVLLYGAKIWTDALDKEMHRNRLPQVQRPAVF